MFAMKTTSYGIVAATALVAFIAALAALSVPTKAERQKKFMAALHVDFESSRVAFEQFVAQAGSDGGRTGSNRDFSSIRDTPLGKRVARVRRDGNGNLYFVLEQSRVTFNVGLIWQSGSGDFLGDGEEPRVTHTEKLAERWFFYHAS